MSVVIELIGADRLPVYADIPMNCEVRSMLSVKEIDGAMELSEHPAPTHYTKNYDAYADGGPLNWPKRFDISQWGIWIAHDRGDVVGGAAVAWNTATVEMLEGRRDLAVLWDIRVRPTAKRRGVGSALFQEAARWAGTKDCRTLKIETQNVNVDACRFYAKMGCVLERIDRLAYRHCAEIADEIMLVWHHDLSVITQ